MTLEVENSNRAPQVTVVSVLHNSEYDLPKMLASIAIGFKGLLSPELILVDSGSVDRSVVVAWQLIERYSDSLHPSSGVIDPGENIGFGRGSNLGVEIACGDTIMLLNPDAVLVGSVERVLLQSRCHGTGAVGAFCKTEQEIWKPSYGKFPSAFRPLERQLMPSLPPSSLNVYRVDWVEGSFLVVDRSKFIRAGGFDERIFLYGEDMEFCKRLGDTGLQNAVVAETVYMHEGGYTPERDKLVRAGVDFFVDLHGSACGRLVRSIVGGLRRLESRSI
jgi:GT2 family glycosyltransferase